MNANIEYEERQELVVIYNSLSPSLKRQLLTIARVIDTTQDITLREGSKKKIYKKD